MKKLNAYMLHRQRRKALGLGPGPRKKKPDPNPWKTKCTCGHKLSAHCAVHLDIMSGGLCDKCFCSAFKPAN